MFFRTKGNNDSVNTKLCFSFHPFSLGHVTEAIYAAHMILTNLSP